MKKKKQLMQYVICSTKYPRLVNLQHGGPAYGETYRCLAAGSCLLGQRGILIKYCWQTKCFRTQTRTCVEQVSSRNSKEPPSTKTSVIVIKTSNYKARISCVKSACGRLPYRLAYVFLQS
jgi:hypothetical protein